MRTTSPALSIATLAAVLAALLVPPGVIVAQEGTAADPAADPARVRFVSGSFHGPADVYADGALMAQALEFATVTDYMDVPSGEVRFETVGSGMSLDEVRDSYGTGLFPNAAEATTKLKPGLAYTVIVNGADSGHTEFRFTQDRPKPKAGQAQARVVDMCTYCGPMDFSAGKAKKPFAKGLDYTPKKQASKYLKLKAGELDVIPRVQGFKQPAGDLEPVTLEPGTASSLFMVGRFDAGTMTLVPALDAAISDLLITNASTAGPKLDVYLDGKRVAKKVAPGESIKAKGVIADEHDVQLVRGGADLADGALLEGTVTLQPGSALLTVGLGADAPEALSRSELAPGAYQVLMATLPEDGSMAFAALQHPVENVLPEPEEETVEAGE